VTLTDWGSWAAIVAGVLAIVASIYAGLRFVCHKIVFRNPCTVLYLIPQAAYPCKQFKGAPAQELTTHKMVIGIGQYVVMNEFIFKSNLEIDLLVLSFEGPSQNKPFVDAPENPFIIDYAEISGVKYRKDWWGNMYPYSTDVTTRYCYKNIPLLTGHKVTTSGIWKGKACLTIPIHSERAYIVKLDFEVSEKEDLIPFLKVQETNKVLPLLK
jgi:hypothetical protein